MPPIRPSQFSALKVLDPPHQQEENGEDDDRQADVQHIQHRWPLLGVRAVMRSVKPPVTCQEASPCAIHAAPCVVLTTPMRPANRMPPEDPRRPWRSPERGAKVPAPGS